MRMVLVALSALGLTLSTSLGLPTGARALDLALVLSSPKPCFKRIYSAEHLNARPKQLVSAIGIETEGDVSRSAPFAMTFSVRRRSDRARFHSPAVCRFTSQERVQCDLEGDGGTARFWIGELNGKKRIRLETDELRFEGADGFFSFGRASDDSVFYLGSYRIHHCPV
jgi:hypothetical protein